jgi:hypothetical protein
MDLHDVTESVTAQTARPATPSSSLSNLGVVEPSDPRGTHPRDRWDAVQERRRLETLLGVQPTNRLTMDDIKALVASLRDITATLGRADPADKAAVYAEMGITVTDNQDGRVLVESRPRVVDDGVGGAIPMGATRRAPLSRWYSLTA